MTLTSDPLRVIVIFRALICFAATALRPWPAVSTIYSIPASEVNGPSRSKVGHTVRDVFIGADVQLKSNKQATIMHIFFMNLPNVKDLPRLRLARHLRNRGRDSCSRWQ